jgi:multiple antibiotic resistance protein
MSYEEIAISLFFILDPIGIIPVELALLAGIDPKRRTKILIRECLIALGIMIAFMFFGSEILSGFGVNTASAQIGGGIILFLIALDMVLPSHKEQIQAEKREPLIVPIAIPLIAGPGLLSTIMLYSHREPNKLKLLLVIGLTWLAASLIIVSAQKIGNILGKSGMAAIEKLFGLLLTLMSVNMIGAGIFEMIKIYK